MPVSLGIKISFKGFGEISAKRLGRGSQEKGLQCHIDQSLSLVTCGSLICKSVMDTVSEAVGKGCGRAGQ